AHRGAGRVDGARVPRAARAGERLADVRQLDLPGPALPRALDAAPRGAFPLPQPGRLHAEGAGAALEARAPQGLQQGRQARGACRHPRVDRGAEVLPQDRHDHLDSYSTSTMHSISTGMPIGSEPMPTAERACLPASPNTCTKRSEQPLMTLGCSENSGVAFTMPSSFTTRFTRSRLPSSSRITARRSRPTVRACWYASSRVKSRPTLPLGRLPSAPGR